MIRLGRRNGWGLIALATATLVSVLAVSGALTALENAGADMRARVLMHEVPSDIVIVAIDAASLAALDHWPWPRRHHAKLVEEISRAAPDSVFMDIDFSSQSNALDDAVLEAALAKPRDWRSFWTIDGVRVASIIDPRRVLPDDQDVTIDFSISPTSFTFVSYVDV